MVISQFSGLLRIRNETILFSSSLGVDRDLMREKKYKTCRSEGEVSRVQVQRGLQAWLRLPERDLRRYLSPNGSEPAAEGQTVVLDTLSRRLLFCAIALCFLFPSSALTQELRFSHQISLNPISPLQSVITFVPEGGANYQMVRALLILDGELLAVPLQSEADGKAYRGTFPTPKETLSYQFQAISTEDSSKLSASFEVSPYCPKGQYLPQRAVDPEIRRALLAQQQRQRLLTARDLLRKFMERLGHAK
jgi:hypothetical protein